ncbi:MAG: hypothetical protein H6755_04805 [Candidatus Omnitrophica bacterium]|nr:hypothetical protein [Candidatus Omnitrophota bacterium]MCB9747711.1 hypothetical protein [Candidatus Omnitrophota bacterium]
MGFFISGRLIDWSIFVGEILSIAVGIVLVGNLTVFHKGKETTINKKKIRLKKKYFLPFDLEGRGGGFCSEEISNGFMIFLFGSSFLGLGCG